LLSYTIKKKLNEGKRVKKNKKKKEKEFIKYCCEDENTR